MYIINHAGHSDNNMDIVKNVALLVKSGELVGLIGPTEAGKSTTIKAIMGLLPVMDGKVEFTGESKNYAYIPEQPVLYEGLEKSAYCCLSVGFYVISLALPLF
ncbi:ATP-binding cassette domain-containing protein [Desulfosporosinus nitroreducens]|uniref:ATP-binding cassette domain-containing protein n=1 Tax=Desulfosporosinus nitroreducens TaxID=2018668 RepID=UPI00207D3A3A|nr:ATP-binding cassette domain-containing protein [Desulfosporosinus nitroreducens]MCO1601592.1 ATP-binding cassette domain-containing protein [Desulfosporosinus nitroreducens]